MSTVREVTDVALALLGRFIGRRPLPNSELYVSLGEVQRSVFSIAAMENPEYFLAQAVGILSGGAVDLRLLTAPLAECEAVLRMQIENAGTSGYAAGQRVTVITAMEHDTLGLPPRVRINDGVIQQVGADLLNVVSLRVFYAERPPAYGPLDAAVVVRLEQRWDQLVAAGLALDVLSRYQDIPDPGRAAGLEAMRAQWAESLAAFKGHIRAFAPVTAYRSRRQAPRP